MSTAMFLRSLRGRRLIVAAATLAAAAAAVAVFASSGGAAGAAPARSALTPGEFNGMFSAPTEPETAISPGQYFELEVPPGKKAVITDVYVENLGGGTGELRLLEQHSPISFEVRYTFRVASGQTLVANFTTGLRFGERTPIAGTIRLENPYYGTASILPRVNGFFVP